MAKRRKYNVKYKITPEHREKLSKALRGRKLTPEHAAKVRHLRIGKKESVETRMKKSLAMKGKNYKNGLTPVYAAIRGCFLYRLWRSDCMTRDNFTCQICFIRGGDLEVDHIKRFSEIVKENNIKSVEEAEKCAELWNLNNGMTLCKKCHKKVS